MPVLENARHEKFVQSLISGMSQRKAYRAAFKQSARWKDNTVDSRASELLKVSEVLGRYKELQEQAQDEAIMTRKERMVKLSEIINDYEEDTTTQIKAIETLNKMDGAYLNGTLIDAQTRKALAEAAIVEKTVVEIEKGGGNKVVFVDSQAEMERYMKEHAHEYDDTDK